MPSTTYRDRRHGHPGTAGYLAGHLLMGVAGVVGMTAAPSQAVDELLGGYADFAVRGWAAVFVLAAAAGVVARVAGFPRVELAALNTYGGLTLLWAGAVAAVSPPAVMLSLALVAWVAFAFGQTRAATYRLNAGIDRIERVILRWGRANKAATAERVARDRAGGER
jgi:hypothetical protein